jgi:hypothetical protein
VTRPPLSLICTAVGSSGCETRRRRHLTCYSRPTADWIGINSIAVGCRPLCSVLLRSHRCCFTLAWLSLLHRLDGFIRPGALETRGAPGAACIGRWVLKKLFGALFSELLGSTVFIRPRAAGTSGAPGAVLCREVSARAHGTRASPGAALSREVETGATVTRDATRAALLGLGAALSREVGTGATVTHSAPELPCAGRRVLPPELL